MTDHEEKTKGTRSSRRSSGFGRGGLIVAGATILLLGACTSTFSTGTPTSGGGETPAPGQGRSALDQVADVPVPADSAVDLERSIILGDRDNWSGRLAISSSYTVNEMFDFYRQQMPRFGWTELSVVRAANSVLTYMRDNRIATVQITGARMDSARIDFIVSPRGGMPAGTPPPGNGGPPPPR